MVKLSPVLLGLWIAFLAVIIAIIFIVGIFIIDSGNDGVTNVFKQKILVNCGLCEEGNSQVLCATGSEIQNCEELVEQIFSFEKLDVENCADFTPTDKTFCEASIEENRFAVGTHNNLKSITSIITDRQRVELFGMLAGIAVVFFIFGLIIGFIKK